MNFPFQIITDSPAETENAGCDLAYALCSDGDLPRFVAMYGDLGVGKTAFVRGFCSQISSASVKSPTFALVNEYRVNNSVAGVRKICHFDMYRVIDDDDLYSIGFYDYLRDENICIAEWCEMIPKSLPDRYVKVVIEKIDLESKRKITVSTVGV